MGGDVERDVEFHDGFFGECDGRDDRWRHIHGHGNIDELWVYGDLYEDGNDHESRLYDQWA